VDLEEKTGRSVVTGEFSATGEKEDFGSMK
jgi:hypothetical protein